MIAFLHGRVAHISPTAVVLEVGGVGMELLCTPRTLSELSLGATVTMPATLVVREDSLTLFGFASEDEKSAFLLAQNASGVGPKLAQAIVNTLTPAQLHGAIANEDIKVLTSVPGVGKKSAQRLILELKDRLPETVPVATQPAAAPAAAPWREQLHAGLVGLGWSTRQADDAIAAVAGQADTMDSLDISQLLRLALQWLKGS